MDCARDVYRGRLGKSVRVFISAYALLPSFSNNSAVMCHPEGCTEEEEEERARSEERENVSFHNLQLVLKYLSSSVISRSVLV